MCSVRGKKYLGTIGMHWVYSSDLSSKLQDTLVFIEESMDVTLAKLCSDFHSHIYQRLLNAYRLLGQSFMDQFQMHFVKVVQTRTMDILLKHTGTTNNEQNLSSYVELCNVRSSIGND